VRVPGLVARHAVGELAIERVGELGDVAQGGGLAGPLGERVLPEAVFGCLPGDRDGPVQQRLFTYPRPMVDAENGHAFAGGLIIAAVCDYRVSVRKRAR
jgi:hypothetical protein